MVAAIAGRTVTLSKALDFDHLAQRDPDGNVVLLPRVANLTRNVVVQSENPGGTPGHVADVGHGAMWDVRYAEQNGLGRTRAEHIDSTTADPVHIGTNQVGRYNEHHHHAMGLGSASVGNVYRGGGPKTGKWGLALHGTHDARLERNIAIDFRGAGFVTEDGYEVRNVFRQNFGAYNLNPAMLTANPDVALLTQALRWAQRAGHRRRVRVVPRPEEHLRRQRVLGQRDRHQPVQHRDRGGRLSQ